MPGTTPVYGLPYVELTDAPDIPAATQTLASATEGKFVAVDTAATTLGGRVTVLEGGVNAGNFWVSIGANTDTGSIGTSYVDRTGQVASITKRSASSALLVRVGLGCYVTAGTVPVTLLIGVRINGSDFDITKDGVSALSVRQKYFGERRITGIPAGAQTVQLRLKFSANSGYNVRQDVNDTTSLTVVECT